MNAIKHWVLRSLIVWSAAMSFGSGPYAQMSPVTPQLRSLVPTPVAAAYDARTGTVFLGSGSEVRKMEQGPAGHLADRGTLPVGNTETILRLRVDARRDRLWVLDIGTVRVFDLSKNRVIRTVVLPNWMFAAQSDNCLPDLQLNARGTAFISDNVQPRLWRIDPEDFSVHESAVALGSHGSLDVGFSALAVTEQGALFAAMAAPGLLWRVSTDLRRAENVPLSAPIYGACALEGRRPANAAGAVFFVLTAGRSAFEVRQVFMAPGAARARVDVLPSRSPASHAAMLLSNDELFLAANAPARTAATRRQKPPGEWVLTPISIFPHERKF